MKTWNKYQLGLTNTGILYETMESKLLPTLTVCATNAYKNKGFFFNESDYLANSFSLEEIFIAKTVKALSNESNWKITEVRSPVVGRCFALQYLH